MRPGILAVRASNEYQRRDIIGYLGLRYYLLASCARTDRWSWDVASDLVRFRKGQPYRSCKVYKGVSERRGADEPGVIESRELRLPAPNEMLCEAALLSACAEKAGPFGRHPAAFSNILCRGESREGMVEPYFKWWKERQRAIGTACYRAPTGMVVYYDLKQFYPSIEHAQIESAWRSAAEAAGLETRWRAIGDRIIADYRSLTGGRGLPMGPMFAHILGNLVLRTFDQKMTDAFPRSYFRYVDDIALVIPSERIKEASQLITAFLPSGLELNSLKQVQIEGQSWLRNSLSFEASVGVRTWMRLIGGIKTFMATRPEAGRALHSALRAEGFRFPFRDYTAALKNRSAWERLQSRLKESWFRHHVENQDVASILRLARAARVEFFSRFRGTLDLRTPENGMERKLHIQRLRYLAARLLYLCRLDDMRGVADSIDQFRELSELAAIYRAVANRDVTDLLPFTETVARVAAQVLASDGGPVTCRRAVIGEELTAARIVLELHGIQVEFEKAATTHNSALATFAGLAGPPPRNTLDAFHDELLALRSGSDKPAPQNLLMSAFDEAEDTTFDATSLFLGSS